MGSLEFINALTSIFIPENLKEKDIVNQFTKKAVRYNNLNDLVTTKSGKKMTRLMKNKGKYNQFKSLCIDFYNKQ